MCALTVLRADKVHASRGCTSPIQYNTLYSYSTISQFLIRVSVFGGSVSQCLVASVCAAEVGLLCALATYSIA